MIREYDFYCLDTGKHYSREFMTEERADDYCDELELRKEVVNDEKA